MQRVAEHVRRSPSAGVIIMSFKRWIICCSWTYFKINCFSSSSSSPSHRPLFALYFELSAHHSHNTPASSHTNTGSDRTGRAIGSTTRFSSKQQLITHNSYSSGAVLCAGLSPTARAVYAVLTHKKHVNVVIISFPEIFVRFMRLKVFVMPSTFIANASASFVYQFTAFLVGRDEEKIYNSVYYSFFSDTLKYDKCLTLFGRVQCWDLFVRSHFKTIIYDQHTPHTYISSHSSRKRCRSLVQKDTMPVWKWKLELGGSWN